MIGTTLKQYRITGKIGAGGMGVVYEALDTSLDRTVALKFLPPGSTSDPDAKARFIQEAKAASALDHPNICVIHEIGETDDGRLYLSMARYEGETLKKRIGRGPLTPVEALRVAVQIADGLAQAHERNIVHRDIKPSNIFITSDGLVKILDFGLAKLSDQSILTRDGSTPGTVCYMAPEQAQSQGTDPRTDVWSLGIVLYEMLTGSRPFQADFDPAVIYAIINRRPPSLHEADPDIPASLSDLVFRCMRKSPDRRFASGAELLAAMADLVRAEGWPVPLPNRLDPPGIPPEPGPRRIRWKIAAPVGLIVLLAVALAAFYPRSPYATDLRVAVMPFENRAGPERDVVGAGLNVVVTRMLEEAARTHPSMWVVRKEVVDYAQLVKPEQAARAFGVNRIVTGGLEVFREGEMLRLELRDAGSMATREELRIPLEPKTVLADSLPRALARLLDLPTAGTAPIRAMLPSAASAMVDYLEGLGHLDRRDPGKAGSALARVTDSDPGFAPGWCARGVAAWGSYRATGDKADLDQALAWLGEAADRDPHAWRPPFHRGEILRMIGDPDGALAAFAVADSLDPGNAYITQRMSRVYRAKDMVAEGERILRTAIERSPDYFMAQRSLGDFHYRLDAWESALPYLERARELAPDDAKSWNTAGVVYSKLGRYDLMKIYHERSFALLPDCYTANNLAATYYHEADFRRAASYFELSKDYCGEMDSDTWANWGRCLYHVDGARSESVEKLKHAITLIEPHWRENPHDAHLIGELIELYALSGDETASRRLIALADSLGNWDAEICYRIGDAYEVMGERTAALRYLRESVRHGTPLARIETTPELADLVTDPRYVRLVAAQAEAR